VSGGPFIDKVYIGADPATNVLYLAGNANNPKGGGGIFVTKSVDGGATFSKNERVSSALSDEQYSHHQNGDVFLGDYRDMGSSRGSATMVWVDTRNHKADAYVATVGRPSADGK